MRILIHCWCLSCSIFDQWDFNMAFFCLISVKLYWFFIAVTLGDNIIIRHLHTLQRAHHHGPRFPLWPHKCLPLPISPSPSPSPLVRRCPPRCFCFYEFVYVSLRPLVCFYIPHTSEIKQHLPSSFWLNLTLRDSLRVHSCGYKWQNFLVFMAQQCASV